MFRVFGIYLHNTIGMKTGISAIFKWSYLYVSLFRMCMVFRVLVLDIVHVLLLFNLHLGSLFAQRSSEPINFERQISNGVLFLNYKRPTLYSISSFMFMVFLAHFDEIVFFAWIWLFICLGVWDNYIYLL